ncbi:hypothetical protein F5Y17DRAFT_374746 [Xylariaceae sp. FL0594]|nr:hypothetical protein F5Y17DRAFT_374746 [Xylariaceae sp. FL0594]
MVFSKLRTSLRRGQSSGTSSNNNNNEPSSPTTPTHQASATSSSSSDMSSSSSSSWSPPQIVPAWLRSSLSSSSHQQRKRSALTPKDPAYKRLNKPFTPQNLEHQKLFSAFDWNLAEGGGCSSSQRRRRRRQGQDEVGDNDYDDARSFVSGISPCASTRPSIDYGRRGRFDDEGQHHPLPPRSSCVGPTDVANVASRQDNTSV